jgi:pyrroloquinoline quinone biosynthesis protein B
MPEHATGPYAIVLGTAQDAGLPQIGCRDELCERARREPVFSRRASSIAVVDPRSGKRWLFDAGPGLDEHVELLRDHGERGDALRRREPLFDAVFLTHAHTGHYSGLLQLGREAYAARGQVVYGSERMLGFLRGNGPWSLLVETSALELRAMPLDRDIELADDLLVAAMRVPHRDEFSDTLAFAIHGPRASLLYLPDVDKWERWEKRLQDVLARFDVALIDGTFYAAGEVAGRSMAEIPHPFIAETLARLAEDPPELRARVVFTHLNHTNPAVDPAGEAQAAIRAAGMRVAREGEIIEL